MLYHSLLCLFVHFLAKNIWVQHLWDPAWFRYDFWLGLNFLKIIKIQSKIRCLLGSIIPLLWSLFGILLLLISGPCHWWAQINVALFQILYLYTFICIFSIILDTFEFLFFYDLMFSWWSRRLLSTISHLKVILMQ